MNNYNFYYISPAIYRRDLFFASTYNSCSNCGGYCSTNCGNSYCSSTADPNSGCYTNCASGCNRGCHINSGSSDGCKACGASCTYAGCDDKTCKNYCRSSTCGFDSCYGLATILL